MAALNLLVSDHALHDRVGRGLVHPSLDVSPSVDPADESSGRHEQLYHQSKTAIDRSPVPDRYDSGEARV